jgi:ATP-dependent Clp protease ATP-binding subunit ClpC
MKDQLMDEVEKHFRPEFLNRVDDVIVFRMLGRDDLAEIVELELDKVRRRLAAQDMQLHVSPLALELIIDKGYNPDFGARPLRRAVERYLEDPLSEHILTGRFREGRIVVDVLNGELHFERAEKEKEQDIPAVEKAAAKG